jgi:hypothetical protein
MKQHIEADAEADRWGTIPLLIHHTAHHIKRVIRGGTGAPAA